MRVLGIETSCDETGVALYDTERGLWRMRFTPRLRSMRSMAVWCQSL